VPHDVRDQVVDFVRRWSEKTEISVGRFPQWLGIGASKFYDWRQRYGRVNEHNGWIPRDFWLEPWEKEAIIGFHLKNPLEGYRRLTFMMLDAEVVAVSPASVWRVLKQAGLLSRWKGKPSRKGTGFEQPPQPHQHWHIDVSYINLSGTFYYLCSVLDGYSRSIVHWDLRESMKEAEIEMILERAKEKYPEAKPRIISLVDLHKGEGNYYLAYYDGKRRQMPSVGRFADAAKLVQRRKQLDALASGVELAPEPEPKAESDIVAEVNKFLEQQQAFVGNDGYGAAKKSISAYRNGLGFYLRFLVRPSLACYRRIANSRSSCRGRDHALSGALEALTPSRAPVVSVMGIGR
jgi:hypothetical protein